MIGVCAIGTYIPEGRISNRDRLEEFDATPEFLESKIGIECVARRADGEDTGDLCVRAFEALKATPNGADVASADCVIVCTQNPDAGGLPHTSAVLHGRLDLPSDCACFDISLGCSGYVHALSVAVSFMEANGLETGLLFTADPYSKIVDPADRNTAMIFGDAATVSLLAPIQGQENGFLLKASRFHTEGARAKALMRHGETLSMDGRAVFNFSAVAVPKQILSLLEAQSLALDDVDYFLLHQGSKFLIDAVRKRLGVSEQKLPFAVRDYGNTVSSSVPLLLAGHLDNPAARRLVLSGFGVGLASASCLLERN